MSIAACVVRELVGQGFVDGSADFFEGSGFARVEFVSGVQGVADLEVRDVNGVAAMSDLGHADLGHA
ncbi:MAG: hypothetical protein KDC95_02030 [Planctomycetes bacterium]|nr:hypothetical protein [Planctomycetota bacterium]